MVDSAQRGGRGRGAPSLSERVRWASTYLGDFIISAIKYEKNGETYNKYFDLVHHPTITEVGHDIILHVPSYPGSVRAFVSLHLTALTEKELLLVKNVFDKAVELALPIVKERDRIAEEEYQAGKEFYARVYRPLPRLFEGKGLPE